jgi:hypothetical protein
MFNEGDIVEYQATHPDLSTPSLNGSVGIVVTQRDVDIRADCITVQWFNVLTFDSQRAGKIWGVRPENIRKLER